MFKDQERLPTMTIRDDGESDNDSFLNFSIPDSPYRNADEGNNNAFDKANESQGTKYIQFIVSLISIESQNEYPSSIPLYEQIDDYEEYRSMSSTDSE